MSPVIMPGTGTAPEAANDPLGQAIAWKLEQNGAPRLPPRRQAAFQAWLEEKAAHRNAWQKLEQMDATLGHLDNPGRTVLARHRPKVRSGRHAARATLALALLFGGATALHVYRPLTALSADYATPTAAPAVVTLPDGSRLLLDARSAVDVAFNSTERKVILRAGTILIETARDPAQRPFTVVSDQGSMRALGTRFMVDDDQNATTLTVLEHAVLASADTPDREAVVEANQTLRIEPGKAFTVTAAPGDADAWVDGMLVVHDAPLENVIRQFSRYRFGHLQVDPAIAQLRVSGTFSLRDTDRSLLALSSQLPIRIRRLSSLWVDVLPASTAAQVSR